METAYSTLCPTLYGKIVRWIDDVHFIALCKGREVLGHRDYWRIVNEANYL